MSYLEDEYLLLSGIQHFIFCRRQWALIHIEQQWEENYRTVDGAIMHRHAHDGSFREKRGELLITRGMAISSRLLGFSGQCDVVEFRREKQGISLPDEEGLYRVVPVEYKRGNPKADLSDEVQLAAQAMCLEEMLCCEIPEGFLYYGEIRRRVKVAIDDTLRETVQKTAGEMHDYARRGYTPKVKRTKACNACSLKNICLPGLGRKENAAAYVNARLAEEDSIEKTT